MLRLTETGLTKAIARLQEQGASPSSRPGLAEHLLHSLESAQRGGTPVNAASAYDTLLAHQTEGHISPTAAELYHVAGHAFTEKFVAAMTQYARERIEQRARMPPSH